MNEPLYQYRSPSTNIRENREVNNRIFHNAGSSILTGANGNTPPKDSLQNDLTTRRRVYGNPIFSTQSSANNNPYEYYSSLKKTSTISNTNSTSQSRPEESSIIPTRFPSSSSSENNIKKKKTERRRLAEMNFILKSINTFIKKIIKDPLMFESKKFNSKIYYNFDIRSMM
jgi:hypothetical protein